MATNDPGLVIHPTALTGLLGRGSGNVALHLTRTDAPPVSIVLRPEQAFALQDLLEEILGRPDQRPGHKPRRPERSS